MNRAEIYRGFEISWEEPPLTSAQWTANVASDDPALYDKMCRYRGGRHGAEVIDGGTREEMHANAKAYIDKLLG
jgi:hypothetical protein